MDLPTLVIRILCFGMFTIAISQKSKETQPGYVTSDVDTCVDVSDVCAYWEFSCGDGSCVSFRRFCDGFIDCGNGMDELQVNESSNLVCKRMEYTLFIVDGNLFVTGLECNTVFNQNQKRCILPQRYNCDGIQHCQIGVDESKRICETQNRYIPQCLSASVRSCVNIFILQCPECDQFTKSEASSGYVQFIGNDTNHHCASVIYRCKTSRKCLSAAQFCDGVINCEDGSDEITQLQREDSGVICNNKWNYINKECVLQEEFICDGIDHCVNRVDECQLNCQFSFNCNDGKCLPKRAPEYFLDGRDDCGDSSDECGHGNKITNFICADNITCVAFDRFCDGRIDCPDGSDEIMQQTKNNVMCSNIDGSLGLKCALPMKYICDGRIQCSDHVDEWNCNHTNMFKCSNKKIVNHLKVCDYRDHCEDSSDECKDGCNKTFICPFTRKCIAFSRFCDGIDDCGDGSDEIVVNDDVINGGIMCINKWNRCSKKCVLPSQYVCDGQEHCFNRIDECVNGCNKSFYCDDGECLPKHVFCDEKIQCKDKSDEKVTGTGFKCDVITSLSDKVCVLPQRMINDGIQDCRLSDESDECTGESTCFRCLTGNILISSKQICDGTFDCPDLSDECLCESKPSNFYVTEICNTISLRKKPCIDCSSVYLSCDDGQAILRLDQICDNLIDCNNGIDEIACSNSPLQIQKYVTQKKFNCKYATSDEFAWARECDGIPECLDLEDECSGISPEHTKRHRGILPLDKGSILPSSELKCGAKTSELCSLLGFNDFGVYSCPHQPGVLLSSNLICDGIEHCTDSITKSFKHLKVVRTWSDFSVDEKYCRDRRWLCHKSRPTDENKVSIMKNRLCDGNIDCAMEEDESIDECSHLKPNRFYCETRVPRASSPLKDPLYVMKSSMFNRKNDCLDGSDECPYFWMKDNPFSSRFQMIKNSMLSGFIWLISLIAMVGNSVVIIHTAKRLTTDRRISPMMRNNLVLVFNLALADFLMGIYLLALAIQNVATNKRYCRIDHEWRSSDRCEDFGTIVVISVQSSVIILVILTSFRVAAVLRPFKADGIHLRYTFLVVLAAWSISFALAIIPRMNIFKDYFTTSAYISNIDFFETNSPSKATLVRFVKILTTLKYDDVNSTLSLELHERMSWATINKLLEAYYPHYWPDFKILSHFGYYSENAVCLPKIFVEIGDISWEYSFGMMLFDFFAFFYVMSSYLVIYRDASQSVARSGTDIENKTMQTRITRLVLTDFTCWGPVCIIAMLRLTGVYISPFAYSFSAIVLLPINSALNPILYSNIKYVLCRSCIKPIRNFMRKRAQLPRTWVRHRSVYSRSSLATTLSANYTNILPDVGVSDYRTNSFSFSNNTCGVNINTTRL